MLPVTTLSQDTNEHTISNDLNQQPWYDDSGGQALYPILLNHLQLEPQTIASFSIELSTDQCQQQSNPSDDPPPLPPLVCNHSNAQLNTFTLLYYRLLPLILYKSHLMVREM